jgi:Retroviral aspartyl protease
MAGKCLAKGPQPQAGILDYIYEVCKLSRNASVPFATIINSVDEFLPARLGEGLMGKQDWAGVKGFVEANEEEINNFLGKRLPTTGSSRSFQSHQKHRQKVTHPESKTGVTLVRSTVSKQYCKHHGTCAHTTEQCKLTRKTPQETSGDAAKQTPARAQPGKRTQTHLSIITPPASKDVITSVDIEGKIAQCLFDTGSTASFIDEHLIKETKLTPSSVSKPFRIKCATGETTIRKKVTMGLQYGQDQEVVDLHALPNLPYEIILGRDVMKKTRCRIDYADETITLNKVPFTFEEPRHHNTYMVAKQQTIIECGKTGLVSATSSAAGIALRDSSCMLTDTIVRKGNNTIPIYNNGSKAMCIEPGDNLAEVYQLTTNTAPHEHESRQTTPVLSPEVQSILRHYKERHSQQTEEFAQGITHRMTLEKPTAPINIRNYRMAEKKKDFIKTEVKELLAKGIIEDTVSAWNSPLVIVNKKDGTFRMCVDY